MALKKGASSNALYQYGQTALMIAAGFGDEDAPPMMRLLLDAGADVNKQRKDGWTALMSAASLGHDYGAELMRLLLEAGADPNKQEQDGGDRTYDSHRRQPRARRREGGDGTNRGDGQCPPR